MNQMSLLKTPLIVEPEATPGQRVAHDYYPTPEAVTNILLQNVPSLAGQRILEPCAGNGAISDVLRSHGCQVVESDIQWDGNGPKDATTADFWEIYSKEKGCFAPQWVVTNPPFSLAEEILTLAYSAATEGCAFLLRLSYLEPTSSRAEWLKERSDNLRFVIPINPRPRFRRDSKGTDSVTSAWFIWDKRWSWTELGIKSPFVFETEWR